MKNNFKNFKKQKKGFTTALLRGLGFTTASPRGLGFTTAPPRGLGFTLIESLVGITILLVSVIGPLYIAFQGVSLSILAKNQVIASYLAQEGIEFVRFRIATNSNMDEDGIGLILPTNSDYSLLACSWQRNGGNYCTINVFDNTTANCNTFALPGDECPYIKYNSTNHTYNYSDGEETFFRRSIRINHNNLPTDTEFQVESEVEWGRPDNLRSIVLKEVIRDWRP